MHNTEALWCFCEPHRPTILIGLPLDVWGPKQKKRWVSRMLGAQVLVATCMRRDRPPWSGPGRATCQCTTAPPPAPCQSEGIGAAGTPASSEATPPRPCLGQGRGACGTLRTTGHPGAAPPRPRPGGFRCSSCSTRPTPAPWRRASPWKRRGRVRCRASRFPADGQRSPEYLAVNPKGRVPSLVTDKGVLTETPAILAFIAQTFPRAGLAPLGDPFAFAQVQAFNSYLCSTVHVAHAHRMRGHRWADDPAAIAEMRRKAPQAVGECFDLIERGMLRGPWVMGDAHTICDPYLFTLAQWLEADGVDPARLPKVREHRKRMSDRPAVRGRSPRRSARAARSAVARGHDAVRFDRRSPRGRVRGGARSGAAARRVCYTNVAPGLSCPRMASMPAARLQKAVRGVIIRL